MGEEQIHLFTGRVDNLTGKGGRSGDTGGLWGGDDQGDLEKRLLPSASPSPPGKMRALGCQMSDFLKNFL